MKILKTSILTILTLVAFLANVYSNNTDNTKTVELKDSVQAKQAKQLAIQDTSKAYTCSMHPEEISDKLGNCPKCGMELVLKNSDTSAHKHKMGMMCMMHGDGHHPHAWMYIAGGAMMIVMMAIMIL